MKRNLVSALILVIALALAVGVCQSQTTSSKADLEKTVNTFFGFVKSNNVDKIKTYLTPDYTFTGPDGKMLSVEERIKMLKDASGPTVVDVSEITVRTYGSSGLATGIATTKDASGATLRSRFIQVWVWQGGSWHLAASQITPIA